MVDESQLGPVGCAVVSFDIVGHGSIEGLDAQREQLIAINAIVSKFLASLPPSKAIWASRGDGGHVVLCMEDWPIPALELLTELDQWSSTKNVGLKIVGHAGHFPTFRGADGRWEFVGDDINLVGRLVALSGRGGILITESFRESLTSETVQTKVTIDEIFEVAPKFFRPLKLSALSLIGSSRQPVHLPSDAWKILLEAKTRLQMNGSDETAKDAIRRLENKDFIFFEMNADGTRLEMRLNPILGHLSRQQRVELIEASNLIHCEPGAQLCLDGDSGDTMCIVLSGHIGVYVRGQDGKIGTCIKQKAAGDLVGELAFVLNRRRSADVRSLDFSTLLAFSPSELRRRLPTPSHVTHLVDEIRRLLSEQAARYLCESLDFLPHPAKKAAPLDALREPWLQLEHRIDVMAGFFRGDVIDTSDEFFDSGGIYIVEAGELEHAEIGGPKLLGSTLDIIHVAWPRELVMSPRSYEVKSKTASIRRLDIDAIDSLNDASGGSVINALKAVLVKQTAYHVAITYSGTDLTLVQELQSALDQRGYRTYFLKPTFGEFVSSIRQAFTCALVHMVILTADASERARKQGMANWVIREVEFRRALFGDARANILVLSFGEAAHDLVVPGIAPVSLSKDADISMVADRVATELALLCTPDRLPFMRERILRTVTQPHHLYPGGRPGGRRGRRS